MIEESTMIEYQHAIMSHFAARREDHAAAARPFGGRPVLVTGDVFQLGAHAASRRLQSTGGSPHGITPLWELVALLWWRACL